MSSLHWISCLGIFACACGGSAPPAETASTPSETAAEPESAPASDAPTSAETGEEEGWSGENEATEAPPAEAPSGEAETRTKDVVMKVVLEHRDEIKACYKKAKEQLPDLKGDLVIHFVLDPEGKVKKAELNQERSTLKAPPLVDCALERFRSIQFPPSSRAMETDGNYPFTFTH
jgi:hypothetical protein